MSSWLVILLVLALLYLLYKVVVFVRADADLTLLSRTLDTRYFDNKVVWVTGASSGSEYKDINGVHDRSIYCMHVVFI